MDEQRASLEELFHDADEYGFKTVDVTVIQEDIGATCTMTNVPVSTLLATLNFEKLTLVSWRATLPLRVTPQQIEAEAKRVGFTHVNLVMREKHTEHKVSVNEYPVSKLSELGGAVIEKWEISTFGDAETKPHPHYFKDVRHLGFIDVYRVLDLFEVTDPCITHAVKKLLVSGKRGGGKDRDRDIQEAIDSLERYKEMRREENGKQDR